MEHIPFEHEHRPISHWRDKLPNGDDTLNWRENLGPIKDVSYPFAGVAGDGKVPHAEQKDKDEPVH